jgi:serine phosphatase RsbU (regulator of sigma subunit)
MADPKEALQALTESIGAAVRADAAVVRFLDEERQELVARAVWGASPKISAELAGSRRRVDGDGRANGAVLRVPVRRGKQVVGELEVHRLRRPFDLDERQLAESAAAQAAIVLQAIELAEEPGGYVSRTRVLQLAGDALAVSATTPFAAEQLVRLARQAAGASGALLWRADGVGGLSIVAGHPGVDAEESSRLEPAAADALESRVPPMLDRGTVALRLGEPPLGVLQLLFPPGFDLAEEEVGALTTFAVRSAQALRLADSSVATEVELERTRALVAVIGQAIARLSLAHTLETAVDRIVELLGIDRVAVYLREEGRLQPVAGRGLVGPHARVGERLLALSLGPFRGRGALILRDAAHFSALDHVRGELAESGIEAVLAVPLLAREEVIGLLAVYPPHGRTIDENEAALMSALGAQLAVAVENARLHEQAKRLGTELEQALSSERHSARQLRALYEISRSFTNSLSLDATLDAVARTVVETLGVDAAAVRMAAERADVLEARAVHVAEPQLEALRAILGRPQPTTPDDARRLFRTGGAIEVDAAAAADLPPYELLAPFLEQGASCSIVPIAIPGEVLATLTIVSLDPSRTVTGDRTELALTIAGQAALAIDNARLYQQQQGFLDSMQRSLLPRAEPDIAGLELGAGYESSARVDVGGDVYDFLPLGDGSLAVVLGDVAGHGIEAAADMAMAKFVFRSLAREHPEPGEFLAFANDVVTSEIAVGKFITLAYVRIDVARREVACSSAGHPPPRLLRRDGSVTEVASQGFPLGIERGERYAEVRAPFDDGSILVLYTDGVVEERGRGGELYGVERLDKVLATNAELPAKALAAAILDDCRAFGGGALADDCAIVVIKRIAAGPATTPG